MCISTETMNEIESSLLDFHQLSNNPLPMLKDCFPKTSFLRMSAADIDEAPFRSLDNYNLYLLDGREHCVQLTSDLSTATAIVVAHK
ncbi:MAG: hypothetical protein PSV17_13305 [Methylotenera sp.]|uniref:hypothetical protein n=1 Tax=Methylotenera sp. TaxID=2051956 RepID=UPI002486D2B7|nr:hypothetical protein [Methylotenera sp.]MDI1310390.1 hypothetical protein [Methylotenera sp.]